MCVTWASHDSIGSCRHLRTSCFKGTKPCFLCVRDANRFVCGSLMMRRWHETGQSLVRFKLLQPTVRLMCGQSELRQSVGMWRSTKAVCSTNNVLCMWLVFHQHTQYSIYILSTDPALNVKLFMLSQPLYPDTEMCVFVEDCVCVCVCVCLRQIALSPPRPLPCGCAVLCSGRNDGFCASQSPSQQDTHIKGSFSGQPSCMCFL